MFSSHMNIKQQYQLSKQNKIEVGRKCDLDYTGDLESTRGVTGYFVFVNGSLIA